MLPKTGPAAPGEMSEEPEDDQEEAPTPLDSGDPDGFDHNAQTIQVTGGSLQIAGRDVNSTTINYNDKVFTMLTDGRCTVPAAPETVDRFDLSARVPKRA